MKIYKLKHAAVLLAAVGMFQSCAELDVQPESFVTPESYYKNSSELNSGLAGVYDGLQNAYSEANCIFGEYRADSFIPAPTTTNVSRTSFHDSNMNASDGSLRWNNFYTTIDRANRVIIAGEALEGADKNIIGQAYAIRSKVYFDLIRIWKNVPLFLSPITKPSDAYRPVTSYDEIMNTVVIPDMLKAESLTTSLASSYYFSKASIYSHQAEVYMWNKNEALAVTALDKLFSLNAYSLVTTPQAWQNMFYNQPANNAVPDALGKIQTGTELIFSIRYDDADTTPSGLWRAWVAGSSSTVISPDVENKWIQRFPDEAEAWDALYPTTPPALSMNTVDATGATVTVPLYGDWRQFASRERGDFETGYGPAAIGEARLHKWTKDRSGMIVNLDRTDVVMYRLADMILLMAEAKIKLDKPEEARALINQVRSARKLPLVSIADFGATKNDQITYLLDERQFELLGEGKRWWDLIRNDKAFEYIDPILIGRGQNPLTADRLYFPIFQNHIVESVGSYTQNTGW